MKLPANPLFGLLLVVTLLHGIFASGFIPILNHEMGQGANWAFAMYFVGLLLGQLAIYRFGKLSQHKVLFTAYEVLFAGSLLYMGLFPGAFHLTLGRGLEGLAGGLATPLLFSNLVKAPTSLPIKDKIVRYNAVFALGYVSGPVLVELSLKAFPYRFCLLLFGSLFIALNFVVMRFLPPLDPQPQESDLRLSSLFGGGWFEKFYTLFFAKCFYGFLMAFVTAYAQDFFPNWPISAVTVTLAVIFVSGQQLGARTLHHFHKPGLEVILPLGIGAVMLVFWFSHWGGFLFVAAAMHAYLLFIAFLNFTTQMKSGREFALFNSLSDPGMIIGALLVSAGPRGVWVLAALAVLPLLYWRQWPNLRAHNPVIVVHDSSQSPENSEENTPMLH